MLLYVQLLTVTSNSLLYSQTCCISQCGLNRWCYLVTNIEQNCTHLAWLLVPFQPNLVEMVSVRIDQLGLLTYLINDHFFNTKVTSSSGHVLMSRLDLTLTYLVPQSKMTPSYKQPPRRMEVIQKEQTVAEVSGSWTNLTLLIIC